jgi:hypothetical protein
MLAEPQVRAACTFQNEIGGTLAGKPGRREAAARKNSRHGDEQNSE